MRSRIQKWGNSLALRIPKSFAIEVGLSDNSTVDLRMSDGKLVISPSKEEEPTLEELVRGITNENRHGEWDTGPMVGREIW